MIKKILLGLTVAAFASPEPPSPSKAASSARRCKRSNFPKATSPSPWPEVPAGGSAGPHTHPGIETGYVLEGEADLIIEGKTQHLKAGDSYSIPAGAVHDVKVPAKSPPKCSAFTSWTRPSRWPHRPPNRRRHAILVRIGRIAGRPDLAAPFGGRFGRGAGSSLIDRQGLFPRNRLLAGRFRPALRFATRGLFLQAWGWPVGSGKFPAHRRARFLKTQT